LFTVRGIGDYTPADCAGEEQDPGDWQDLVLACHYCSFVHQQPLDWPEHFSS
jgi:hypothetical protein